jgi:uncharacterized protein with beta-barrel porin domain
LPRRAGSVGFAQDTALIEAGLDLSLAPNATAACPIRASSAMGVTDNAAKGRFTWLF